MFSQTEPITTRSDRPILDSSIIRVVDDFYDDPDAVRRAALSLTYRSPPSQLDSRARGPIAEFAPCDPAIRKTMLEKLEPLVGEIASAQVEFRFVHRGTIKRQTCHADGVDAAGLIHLALPEHGSGSTVFFRHKPSGDLWQRPESRVAYNFDAVEDWEEVARVESTFNRLVLYPGALFHAIGTPYFGDSAENARLTQVFFINLKDRQPLQEKLGALC